MLGSCPFAGVSSAHGRSHPRRPGARRPPGPRCTAVQAPSPGPSPAGQFSVTKESLHLRTAGKALVNWWRAVTIQGLCVAVLWLIGLLLLQVPLAPVWALVAGLMTLVPNFGGVIALLGPVFSILVTQPSMFACVCCSACTRSSLSWTSCCCNR